MQYKVSMPELLLKSVEACVDALIDRVGPRLYVATPLGIGKPNPLLNALYHRARADPRIELHLYTALRLQPPVPQQELERRLLAPIAERLFGNYPPLDYERERLAGELPDNVRVVEFYLQAGKYIHNANAQRDYISSDYTHVARDVLARGVNVVLQAVASGVVDGRPQLSLSCNPDVGLDVMRGLRVARERGNKVVTAAQVNGELPMMYGEALIDPDSFDLLVDDPACYHDLFATPRSPVSAAEHMIGLYASTLVKDGGELQIGIGALSDAVTYSLLLRHQRNADYQAALDELRVRRHLDKECTALGGTDVFDEGLFGSSEMFVDGFMHLFKAGLFRRKVYDDLALSRLRNQARLSERVEPWLIDALLEQHAIHPLLTAADVAYLQRFGILRRDVRYLDGQLRTRDGAQFVPDLTDPAARAQLEQHLGSELDGGAVVHAAFFVGTQNLYRFLRELPESERKLIDMRSVQRINHLYGHEELDRLHRKHARFINTTMKVSLLGAASSDTLANGSVVSGVGGQYNFVAMANELPEGRSVLQLRSTRVSHGQLQSNLVWSSEQATIPRHLRDVVVTEYGAAELRSHTDEECVIALLNLADSRFQDSLMREAKRAGKLRASYRIPERYQNNLPESYAKPFAKLQQRGLFPEYPFGSDLDEDERTLKAALERIAAALKQPQAAVGLAFEAVKPHTPTADEKRMLERMQLDAPSNARDKLYRRLLLGALQER
jgi:acyl-CoA hydrolase